MSRILQSLLALTFLFSTACATNTTNLVGRLQNSVGRIEIHAIFTPPPIEKTKVYKINGKKHKITITQVFKEKNIVLGSGTTFAVASDKLITADHICAIVDEVPPYVKIEFRLQKTINGQELSYDKPLIILKRDSKNDMCMLYMEDPVLVPLKVGRHEDTKPGNRIFAFGNPLGMPNMLTSGFVTLPSITFPGETPDKDQTWMTTSLPIYFGNSGGPVLTEDCEVIGVTVAVVPGYFHLSFSPTTEALENFIYPRGR